MFAIRTQPSRLSTQAHLLACVMNSSCCAAGCLKVLGELLVQGAREGSVDYIVPPVVQEARQRTDKTCAVMVEVGQARRE